MYQQMVKLLEVSDFKTYPDSVILLPPPLFNAFFLTYHGLAHFVSEGMHMKQVLDWAMFLKHEQGNIDWKKLYALCDEYHFTRFIHVMTDIAVNHLGVQVSSADIVATPLYRKGALFHLL